MSSPDWPTSPDWLSLSPDQRSQLVREWGREIGFELIGIARAQPLEKQRRALERWLARGFHADMRWMEKHVEVRTRPDLALPGCRGVVVVGVNYFSPAPALNPPSGSSSNTGPSPTAVTPAASAPASPSAATPGISPRGRIARYALRGDYHRSVGKGLRALARRLGDAAGDRHSTRCFVDSGPVLEKAWAQRAGLGFIGKNTLLIHPRRGSWFVLGVLLTTLELAPDTPVESECGACRRCLEACPTGALVEPGILDARRCLSYLTVEHRGEIAPELGGEFREWLFGCDLCQSVCPFNQKYQSPAAPEGLLGPTLCEPWISLEAVARMQEETALPALFGPASPVPRAGLEGLQRTARLLLQAFPKPSSGGK